MVYDFRFQRAFYQHSRRLTDCCCLTCTHRRHGVEGLVLWLSYRNPRDSVDSRRMRYLMANFTALSARKRKLLDERCILFRFLTTLWQRRREFEEAVQSLDQVWWKVRPCSSKILSSSQYLPSNLESELNSSYIAQELDQFGLMAVGIKIHLFVAAWCSDRLSPHSHFFTSTIERVHDTFASYPPGRTIVRTLFGQISSVQIIVSSKAEAPRLNFVR